MATKEKPTSTPFAKGTGTKVGLEIWRIVKMQPVEVDKKEYGSFFSGDCYMVLKTYQRTSSLEYDLHFWLGKKSSQDEQGSVAYWTVVLDDSLGGKPVQHREVQEYESQLFLSHFPKGIQYMDGGADSAFRHVDPNNYKPRLFQVKGKRHVRVTEVELAGKSLNEGDVFILDLGLTIYQWNGKEANKYEKFKALEMVNKIKDTERGGKAKAIFLESGQDDETFWKALGGKAVVKSSRDGGSDDDVKEAVAKLFKVSDASGKLEVTKIAEGKLERKMLDSNDAFIVDSGTSLYVWIGQKATKDERNKGMKHAEDYLKQNNRPTWTPITRIIDQGETPHFKSLFLKWEEPAKTAPASPQAKAKAAIDITVLFAAQQRAAEEKMVDDGTGKVVVYRIENMAKNELPKELYGQFYQGDSYIVHYAYKVNNKDQHIVYFWQGRDSTNDEKGASALLTVELSDSLKAKGAIDPVQVRVVQGHEPNHFLSVFKGKVVIHQGGFPSSFKSGGEKKQDKEVTSLNSKGIALYHVKGTTDFNTHAVQVKEAAASLNSGDCFALITPGTVYLWCGKGSNTHEKQIANNIALILKANRMVKQIEEGHEPNEFWNHLGGKAAYPSSRELEAGIKEPRLFHCTTASTGSFKVTEVFNFSQDDLINDDVMILDTFAEVFVWLGHDSTKEERDMALKTALEYVKKAPDGRSPDTPVYRIFAGAEPPNFTCHFHGWDSSKANDFEDPYQKALKKSGRSDQKEAKAEVVTSDMIGFADPTKVHYTLEELVKGVQNIDLSKKEQYLSDDEFKRVLGVTKEEFNGLQKWKKDELKKKNKLF